MCFCVRTSLCLALPAGNPGVPASVVQLGCRSAVLLCSWPHTLLSHLCSDHMEGLKDFPECRTFLLKHGKSWVSGRWATLYDGVVIDDDNVSFRVKVIQVTSWLTLVSGPLMLIHLLWFFSCLLCKIKGFNWMLMTGNLSIQDPWNFLLFLFQWYSQQNWGDKKIKMYLDQFCIIGSDVKKKSKAWN